MDAHPKSQELLILHLVFLRFVFRDAQSAAYREKVTKRINSELRTDLKFALYAGQPAPYPGLARGGLPGTMVCDGAMPCGPDSAVLPRGVRVTDRRPLAPSHASR